VPYAATEERVLYVCNSWVLEEKMAISWRLLNKHINSFQNIIAAAF
jgi:hypothetical protein